jgi:NhaA family Na+:H+ antiporter
MKRAGGEKTPPDIVMKAISQGLKDFLKMESSAGIVLMFAAFLALVFNNTVLSGLYSAFLMTPVEFRIGNIELAKPLLLWINDGLMAIFFFLIGLEIKRELIDGKLTGLDRSLLPMIAAVGGMVFPALVFISINQGIDENMRGWAIPAATDIAFALGILALLGKRVPVSLKVLLLAIAIIDDLLAITIIALFYTESLAVNYLLMAAVVFAGLVMLNRSNVSNGVPYAILAAVMWFLVLKSGVHATLAGVLTAFTIPMRTIKEGQKPLLQSLEHSLHPWVAFMILPIFAFANAGISFAGLTLSDLFAPLPLGIAMGLFIGKQIGIVGSIWMVVRLKIAKLPEGVNWRHVYGLSLLTGVGFTMSLFIGGLAFSSPEDINAVRIGVLSGSLLSAVCGALVLGLAPARKEKELTPDLAAKAA